MSTTANTENVQKVIDLLKKKISRQAAASFSVCVHCGMCTDTCHYYAATKDPKMAPAYKVDQLRKLYKYYIDWTGRIVPGWVGAKPLKDDKDLDSLMDVLYGSCTMCRRCTINCPMGVDTALLVRIGRSLLTAVGKAPQGVKDVCKDQYETGNQMAVTKQDYLETIEWLSEELQTATGDKNAIIPLDKKNADVVYTINPREVKYAPLSLLAAAKIFYAAGENWTMPSEGWDNTNFGLFAGDDKLGALMGRRQFEKVYELGGKKLVVSECGHGFRATKWEAPNWAQMDLKFPIESFLETMTRYVKDGRIKLNPSVNKESVTYHDPCNLARSSGITEEPRFLLRHSVMDFREMYPNRADNWCCSGGGGAMSMSEYTARRIDVAKVKAEQLKRTEAQIVATACHNCVDALSDLIKYYKLDMKVKVVSELVSEAMVMEKRVPLKVISAEEIVRGKGEKILVIDDEPDVVTFLTTLFEDHGYRTIPAYSVDEALKKLASDKPDMITLDILMPGKTGIKLYHELRTTKNIMDIPVIIITGVNPVDYPQIDFRKFIYERSLPHPEGFMDKPVNKEQLLITVGKIFSQKKTAVKNA
ncbi:MAG: response regulator [Deltaproteobacteria bacterium]|nr:response regulator [Deltaproteobacteria bacterium]